MPLPRLGDMKCSLVRPCPGDKILVRVKVHLDRDQERTLIKKIEKWAGSGVDVLLLNENEIDLEFYHGQIGSSVLKTSKRE